MECNLSVKSNLTCDVTLFTIVCICRMLAYDVQECSCSNQVTLLTQNYIRMPPFRRFPSLLNILLAILSANSAILLFGYLALPFDCQMFEIGAIHDSIVIRTHTDHGSSEVRPGTAPTSSFRLVSCATRLCVCTCVSLHRARHRRAAA